MAGVTLPTVDTVVLYPDGILTAEARVLHTQAASSGLLAVVLDRTPCHPVDAAWPDQPADRGVLRTAGGQLPILDATVGATDGTTLHIGGEVPVRKGTDGWAFLVVHLVAGDGAIAEGDTVTVDIDPTYRAALSAGHTACHLASLALNRALAGAWSKQPRVDALGAPDFDATAIETSRIVADGSVDEFRIGKSARKAGFDPSALDDPGAIAAAANATLAQWVSGGAQIRIERDGDGLTDRRYWVAVLPEGEARIACGGTHPTSLGGLASISVALERRELAGAVGLRMTTTAQTTTAQNP